MNARKNEVLPVLLFLLLLAVVVLSAACNAGTPEDVAAPAETNRTGTTSRPEGSQASGGGLTPAEATVGPDENSNMLPAGGAEPDPAQNPPENPPEGVETFPATTNDIVEGEVDYPRKPPTNGDHAALWQNCGFYTEPVRDENAVHSLDHGAVWITYGANLPQDEIQTLRSYAEEEYVLVSPYPDQNAPVVATAWRNRLIVSEADDPRLEKFVEQFRISQTAPLSGNGCSGGVGDPA